MNQSVNKVNNHECGIESFLHVAGAIIPNHDWQQEEFGHIRQCDGLQQQN